MPARPRLKKGDITIKEILELSQNFYAKNIVDDKSWRALLDVLNAKIVIRRNMEYNPIAHLWEQKGREARIQFIIKTKPESYDDRSGVKIHTYPVNFILRELEKGLDSAFRSRVGSLKKPIFGETRKKLIKDTKTEREAEQVRKENQKIAEKNKDIAKRNILNGVQLQFFYDSMWVWNLYGLLWGPNYAQWPPKKTNPQLLPFFSKHEYFIIIKILDPLFKNYKETLKNI